MSKYSRIGGKFNGKHTTLIPLATDICDVIKKCVFIKTISPGFIKAGLPSAHGRKSIKITEKKGALLLAIRDNVSHQQVHVYVSDIAMAKDYIVHECRSLGLDVSFANSLSHNSPAENSLR